MTRTSLGAHGSKIDLVLVHDLLLGSAQTVPRVVLHFGAWSCLLTVTPRVYFALGGTTQPHACGCPALGLGEDEGEPESSSGLLCSGVSADRAEGSGPFVLV